MAKSITKSVSSDIHIYYYGGCGGFFVLHLLLLSEKYKCIFHSNFDFNDVFKFQWYSKIWSDENVTSWKVLEYQVNNNETKKSNLEHKLFLWANPTPSNYNNSTGYKIVVYSNIWNQFKMAYKKRCFWFNMFSTSDYKQTITDIIGSFDPSQNYDNQMQDYTLCKDFLDKQSVEWNNDRIYHKFKSEIDIDTADIAVKVQDIIKTEGKCLYDPLGLQLTEQVKQFTRDYVELHPPNLRSLLCG
jgi:hypothetical protein